LQLTITLQTLYDIYSADINYWNDPRLAAQNPDVVFPHEPILYAYRSEASGATNVFLQVFLNFL
jgi:phosphate transport system substrate-binding protein